MDAFRVALMIGLAFTAATPAKAGSKLAGAWTISEGVSEMDDSPQVIAYQYSKNKITDQIGRPKTGRVSIVCRENKTDVYFSFGGHFMSGDRYGRLTYRIDKRKAKTTQTSVSNDHKALGLWGGRRSIPFLKELESGKALVIKATPYSENAVTLRFDLTGIKEVLKSVRAACHW